MHCSHVRILFLHPKYLLKTFPELKISKNKINKHKIYFSLYFSGFMDFKISKSCIYKEVLKFLTKNAAFYVVVLFSKMERGMFFAFVKFLFSYKLWLTETS